MRNTRSFIKCDCCGKEIFIPPCVKNDGSFQTPFVEIKGPINSIYREIDLCFTGAGKVYELERRDNNINMVNLRKHIDYLKFGIGPNLNEIRTYHEGNLQC